MTRTALRYAIERLPDPNANTGWPQNHLEIIVPFRAKKF